MGARDNKIDLLLYIVDNLTVRVTILEEAVSKLSGKVDHLVKINGTKV
jgi:hypothetical protein